MLYLLFAHASASAISLVGCSYPPHSTLALGKGIICEYEVDTSALATPQAPLAASVTTTSIDGAMRGLPYIEVSYDTEFGPKSSAGGGAAAQILDVDRETDLRKLTVAFPYDTCTISGRTLVIRIMLAGVEESTVSYQQARECIARNVRMLDNDESSEPRSARQATLTFLLVFLCIVYAFCCAACIYINPDGYGW